MIPIPPPLKLYKFDYQQSGKLRLKEKKRTCQIDPNTSAVQTRVSAPISALCIPGLADLGLRVQWKCLPEWLSIATGEEEVKCGI